MNETWKKEKKGLETRTFSVQTLNIIRKSKWFIETKPTLWRESVSHFRAIVCHSQFISVLLIQQRDRENVCMGVGARKRFFLSFVRPYTCMHTQKCIKLFRFAFVHFHFHCHCLWTMTFFNYSPNENDSERRQSVNEIFINFAQPIRTRAMQKRGRGRELGKMGNSKRTTDFVGEVMMMKLSHVRWSRRAKVIFQCDKR